MATRKTPHVFLLGWAHANPKNLEKYCEPWLKLGLSPYAESINLFSKDLRKQYPIKVEEYYEKTFKPMVQNDDRDIICHMFSNNGAGSFGVLWNLIEQDKKEWKKRVKGVVFDSCPSETIDVKVATDAVFSALYPKHLETPFHRVFSMTLFPFVSLRYAYYHSKNLIFKDALAKKCPYHFLKTFDDFPQNQLYLFSKADIACRDHYIHAFGEHQKSLGKSVERRCWEDSPHVSHLKYHHDEYIQLCQDFYHKHFEGSS